MSAVDTFLEMTGADNQASWRDWITEILITLVDEGEGFSGKRPLGNSGWEYDLAADLTVIDPSISVTGAESRDEFGDVSDDFEIDWQKVNKAWKQVLEELLVG